jgi:hypothetical protein
VASDQSLNAWIVAIPNAFIIFSSAAGTASMAGSGMIGEKRGRRPHSKANRTEAHTPTEEVAAMKSRRFWGSWFSES